MKLELDYEIGSPDDIKYFVLHNKINKEQIVSISLYQNSFAIEHIIWYWKLTKE